MSLSVRKNFAQITCPLHWFTDHTVTFVWGDECQRSFDELRWCLSSAPVLAYPYFQKPFILDTYASETEIGGVLSQLDDKGASYHGY